MGCKDRDLLNDNNNSVSPSLSDALLFTTMCIVGLPVDVQVKDGSVYSGIFHTACVENDYGIVLKKATLIKKGRKEANLANRAVIDTLVILSDDLVQVIAKGVMIPADGIAGSLTGDDVEAVSGSVRPLECPGNELRIVKSSKGAVEVLAAKRNKNSKTRSRNQEEKRSDYGLMRKRVEADLPIPVDKGRNKKAVAAMPLESALGVQHRKADDVHSTLIDEASSVPAVTVHEGQVERNKLRGENNGSIQKFEAYKEDTIHGQCSSSRNESIMDGYSLPGSTFPVCYDASLPQLKSVNGVNVELSAKMSSDETSSGSPVHSLGKPDIMDCERPTSTDSDDLASAISSSSTAVVDIRPQTCSNPLISPTTSITPKGPATNLNAKEFKLNPGAKTFSPVFSAPRSAAPPAVAPVASMAYIPNGSTVAPVVGLQPETGISTFTPHSSLPLKFLQYNNLVAVNGGSGSQYSPPIVGHVGGRPQPVRYAGQYTPLQAGPPYVHPNPQAVMVGRMGQIVYVHPVSHDVFQGAANPSAHALFTTPQVQLPKQQGIAAGQALQICVTPPPFMASSGQQPFSMPVHIPLSQPPFPTVRPIPVPGANGHYGSKFI